MEGVTTAGLLLLLGLACAESKTWTKDTTLSQFETLNIIVNDFNNQSNEEYAFRVLGAHTRPDWDPTFSDPQLVIFTIRETECRKKNLTLEQCPFKDNGKEKTCWGHAKPIDEGLRVMVSCQSQKSGEHWRARRDLRKFLKKHFRWVFKKIHVKEKACYEDCLRRVCAPGARSAAHLPPAVPFPDQL